MQRSLTVPAILLALLVVAPVSRAQSNERIIFDEEDQKWIPVEETKVPAEGVVGQAKALLQAGKYRQAEKLLKPYLKTATGAESDRAQALLMYADAAFLRASYGKADTRYRNVINEFPNTGEYAISLRREFDIARTWLAGKKKRVLGIFFLNASEEALDILSLIEQLAGGFRIAEVALWTKADYYFRTGQFELAEIAFRRLAKEYKSPRYHRIAMYRAAGSALASFPGIAFDDTPLLDATQLYTEYLQSFPNEARRENVSNILEDIKLKRAEKEYWTGRFYGRTRRPVAAAYYYRFVIRTWPGTLWADRSRVELERMGFEVEPES